MDSIQVYELENIVAVSQHAIDGNAEKPPELDMFEKLIQDDIESRTLQLYYLRMSNRRKIVLLTRMFLETKSLQSLAEILHVFFAVNTKLMFYSKVAIDSNSAYDQYINDHDRMLDTDMLNKCIENSMSWFNNLEIHEQTTVMMGLLRLGGGNIIMKMYWRLVKIFWKRSTNKETTIKQYASCIDVNLNSEFEEKLYKLEEYRPKFAENEDNVVYDLNSPTHKKVLEGRKQFQASMAKMKRDLEVEIQALNEPILQKMREKEQSPKSGSPRRSPVGKSRSSTNEIDWLQLLPIWIVKQIFAYFDEKELQKLKNVNTYWAAISKSVLAEKKARINLNSTINKTEESLDQLLDMPAGTDSLLTIGKTAFKSCGLKKRMENLWKTGASRKLEKDSDAVYDCEIGDFSILYENLRLPILLRIRAFPISIPPTKAETSVKIRIDDEFSESTEDESSIMFPVARAPAIVVSMEDLISW